MNGFRPSDLLALPAEERRLLTCLMRRGACSLSELMQHLDLKAEVVRAQLAALMRRGLVAGGDDGTETRYRPRLSG